MTHTFKEDNFQQLCRQLAKKDTHLKAVLKQYGFPPMWRRPASFATLIHIILEQQVSLASARSAFNKLKEKTGTISPKNVLKLSDEEMRACYFSRQKTIYARCLATAILSKQLDLKKLSNATNEDIRNALKQIMESLSAQWKR